MNVVELSRTKANGFKQHSRVTTTSQKPQMQRTDLSKTGIHVQTKPSKGHYSTRVHPPNTPMHCFPQYHLHLTQTYIGKSTRYTQASGSPPPHLTCRQHPSRSQLPLLPNNQALAPLSLTNPKTDPLTG